MKQLSRFCLVIGHAQHGLMPFGFNGSRLDWEEGGILGDDDGSVCGEAGTVDGPLNHPKGMVTNVPTPERMVMSPRSDFFRKRLRCKGQLRDKYCPICSSSRFIISGSMEFMSSLLSFDGHSQSTNPSTLSHSQHPPSVSPQSSYPDHNQSLIFPVQSSQKIPLHS
jgi:hypothetical protein